VCRRSVVAILQQHKCRLHATPGRLLGRWPQRIERKCARCSCTRRLLPLVAWKRSLLRRQLQLQALRRVCQYIETFALNLPESPCALVTFGASGVSATSRYRMSFKLSFGSPAMTAFDFWVAPTLFASFHSTTAALALVVRGNKFEVRTRSAEDAFPSQPNIGCCPVATVPSPLYPGRCVLCSQHIVSSASVVAEHRIPALWHPMRRAPCLHPSAAACNQSSQTCPCRFVGFETINKHCCSLFCV